MFRDMRDPIRLSKILSERGLCSRREADVFISRGWVKVNGEVVNQLGFKADPQADIELLPQAQREISHQLTIILNKPVGYVSNLPEKGYKEASMLLTLDNLWGPQRRRGPLPLQSLAVAGRLDIDSKGLLVFTENGSVAKNIIGENSEVEKEYRVWIDQAATPAQIEQLRGEVFLDGEKLKPMRVTLEAPQRLRFILRQGKKRQIRRVCEEVGLNVTSLLRVRVGNIELGPLPEGRWRFLERHERF